MAAITITVQSLLNAALYDTYTVDDTDTVAAVKAVIDGATGVDSAWYVLVFNDVALADGNTLASYSITDGSSLRTGNVIATLATLEDRQVAKLDLATLDRTADGNPYNVYDINLLPAKYIGNVSTPNPHPDGLIQGRPWIVPQPLSVFYAGEPASYPGAGDTWYNLVSGGSNVTLYNNPTWSNYPGRLTFDPLSSQWGSLPDLGDLSTWTIESWFKLSAPLTGYVTSVISNQFDLATKLNFSMGTNNAPGSYNLCVGFFDGAWHNTAGFAPVIDTWYHVVGTYDGTTIKQYVDGTFLNQLAYAGTPQSGGDVRIASRWDAQTPPSDFFPGDIGVIRIYDTALTADQVLSNYAATAPIYIV